MKIVILHTDFRIYWPARLKALSSYLQVKGHSLIVIEVAGKGSPYEFAEHEEISNLPTWKILFPNMRIEDVSSVEARKAIFKVLNDIKPDVILSGAIAFYSGANAVLWTALNNVPLVVFDNARLEDVRRSNFINYNKKQLYKLVDALLCPAPSHAKSFNYWGFKDESIFYGLNCVDNDFFEQQSQTQNTALPDRYFLNVGRQIEKKNIHFLINSYKQYFKEAQEPIALVIIGDGPLHNSLKLLAGELMNEYIYFLPFQTQNELISIYSNSTAYILPSLYGETWGLTVNEAMSCSKPVIVSNQCGCSETIVKQDINGWIFNPTSEVELKNILLKVGQKEQTEINDIGLNSNKIINNWGLDKFVEGMWNAIQYSVNNKKNKKYLYYPFFLSLFWSGRYRTEMPIKTKSALDVKHIVLLHTDLRIYWQSRLQYLQNVLNKLNIKLSIVEIAGKGSPYEFAQSNDRHEAIMWHVLFPENEISEVTNNDIQCAISNLLDELNPDVLFASALAFPSGAGALKWKRKTERPIVIFDDARPVDVVRPWWVNLLKIIFYRNVDAIVCPAPSHAKGFTKWGLKKEKIFFGVDVIDNDFFKKKEDSILSGKSDILAIGRQVEKKNWLGLLKAFILFKQNKPESKLNLVFIGDGPIHEQLVLTAENREDIIFHTFIQQTDLVNYYHSAKGLVLPSFYGETWGLVVNEALAAGLPVLVSNECGCAETLVKDSVNGWLFNPHDLNSIVQAISKLDDLSDSKLEQFSNESIKIISEWGLSRFTQGILDSLTYITSKPNRKRFWIANILSNFWNGRYRPV